MSIADLYRNRGVNPLAIQLRLQAGFPYRLALDANTVGLWKCDEGAGAILLDRATTPHHATISGATWNALGPWGTGLTYDGSNDKAVTEAFSLGAGNVTMEAVVYHETVSIDTYSEAILTSGQYGTTNGLWLFGIRGNADATNKGKMVFFFYAGADRYFFGNSRCDDGLHYLALTLNRATNEAILYKDGIADGSAVLNISTTALANATLNMGGGTTAYFMGGKIYMVRLSSTLRTASELRNNALLMGFSPMFLSGLPVNP